ncbi:MAG: hypothetical protein ACK2UC_12230, partial [Anaerolineae bacterium]
MKETLRSSIYVTLVLSLIIVSAPFADAADALAAADPTGCSLSILEEGLTTNLADYRGARVPQYAKFEVAFDVLSSTVRNPYFPFDPATPPGIEPGTGISVDALLLPPGVEDWNAAMRLPCFYYQ